MAAIWQRAWSGRYRQLISDSSTRSTTASGTPVSSTTYTTFPDRFLLERERPLVVEEDAGEGLDKETTMELIRSLVEEFCGGANGNVTAPDRWLSELNVAWLLHFAELDASARGIFISQQQLQRLVQSWVLASRAINASMWTCFRGFYSQEHTHKVLVSTRSRKELKERGRLLARDFYMTGSKMTRSRKEPKEHGRLMARDFYKMTLLRYCNYGQDQDEEATTAEPPAASEFVRFVKATLLKMLTFVDAIAAPLNVGDPIIVSSSSSVVGAAEKLRALLKVRDALCTASEQIVMQQSSTRRITEDLGRLLSAELGKLDQAICHTVDHIRTAAMSSLDDDDSWGTTQITLDSSPDIHKVTRSVINSIKVLFTDWWHTDAIISEAMCSENYATYYGLSTLIMELVYSLEEKLGIVSKSFSDQSLGFIFLINNLYFMREQLKTIWTLEDLTCFLNSLTCKINIYIESYLQVSWEPVLECLHKRTLHCFTRNPPLPKFESKFQVTYDAQKLWKVPDPELRKRLREAITEIAVSGFTEYLEDNNRITAGVTPEKVEEMLQELFEG